MSAENPTKINLTSLVFDRFKPILDLKTTSVEGLIRNVALDYYKEDRLKNVSFFSGKIVRVEQDPKKFDYSPFNEINNTSDTNKIRYKVWVYDINSIYSPNGGFSGNEAQKSAGLNIPTDDTDYGRSLISCLQDYIVTDSDLSSLIVGDDVTVSYRDLSNFKDGIIVERTNKSSTGEATKTNVSLGNPVSGSTNASAAFSSSIPAKTIEEQNDDVDIQLYTASGDPGKKVKARAIPSNQGKQLLPVQMAEDFKAMAKQARSENITLKANSGYRDANEQIEIFDQRWTIKYAEGKPKSFPKNKGGQNLLNSIGQAQGTAAYPGMSPHNRGIAVDIQVGGGPELLDKFNSPTYLWLKKNAYKYGFFNTGAKIKSTPEAWHWSYIPENKGNINAVIKTPKERESE